MGDWTERLTGMFQATDSGGREHTIRIFTPSTADPRDGGTIDIDGPFRLVMADGRVVSRVDKGVYLMGEAGEVLRSDDEAAP